jgi:hypothetical protein
MPGGQFSFFQPEIEGVQSNRGIFDQEECFCDESSVGFIEVHEGEKGRYKQLGTEELMEKLEVHTPEESGGKESLRIRIL